MKKLYMLMAALLIASVSFAQIETKPYRPLPVKMEKKPVFKQNNASKNAAAAQWMDYADNIYAMFAAEPTSDDIYAVRVAMDSNGLIFYDNGSSSHGYFFGWSQTYDFNHYIWDDVASEGEISMRSTSSYNIDSVAVLAHYNRGDLVPANAVDTLVVAITSLDYDTTVLSVNSGATPVVQYYGVTYDPATHFQANATFYKIPLTAEDVCEVNPETGGIYPAYFVVPVNLTNIDSKVINIAYSFKRDYVVPMDSDVLDYSYLFSWVIRDPRPDYYPYSSTSGWFTPDADIFDNLNQGAIISDDNLNQTSPNSWYCKYFYPAPIWNAHTHYPDMLVKFSCNDCAIVNVPEIEKNPITVYPNPATNNFTVNLGDNDSKAIVQLFNIVGQQVYNESITGSTQVNVANLRSGVYMLKVTQNGKVTTTKVVVK